jgi:hypothetical protein
MVALICAGAGCRSEPAPVEKREVVGWSPVGSWSGRGSYQTESFTSDTGGFRVRWETRNETNPGKGYLKVVFRSGDSGRPIIEAVDARGVDHDVEEVGDVPRWYYITIESDAIDWSVVVEEPILGTRR